MNPKSIMPTVFPFLRIEGLGDSAHSKKRKKEQEREKEGAPDTPISEDEAGVIVDLLKKDPKLTPFKIAAQAECVEGEWQVAVFRSNGERWRTLRRNEARRVLLAHQSKDSGTSSGKLLDRRI
jgi:hypothetical protein